MREELAAARVSIVIVSYNSRVELDACLRALRDGVGIAHEIVVVDNASVDGTPALVRQQWPTVRLIETGKNLGFARANNVGIRETSGELVLLLNPDTIVTARAIETLVSTLEAAPDVAVIGPRIVDGEGRAELSFGPMISPLAELWQKILVIGNDRGVPIIRSWVDRITCRARRVDWVSGACLLARRADLELVGLLDERYFLYIEDVDLCAAIRARGRAVLFTPDAQIVHLRGRSAASAARATNAAYRRSHIAFYEKHHARWAHVLKAYLKIRGELPNPE